MSGFNSLTPKIKKINKNYQHKNKKKSHSICQKNNFIFHSKFVYFLCEIPQKNG